MVWTEYWLVNERFEAKYGPWDLEVFYLDLMKIKYMNTSTTGLIGKSILKYPTDYNLLVIIFSTIQYTEFILLQLLTTLYPAPIEESPQHLPK